MNMITKFLSKRRARYNEEYNRRLAWMKEHGNLVLTTIIGHATYDHYGVEFRLGKWTWDDNDKYNVKNTKEVKKTIYKLYPQAVKYYKAEKGKV